MSNLLLALIAASLAAGFVLLITRGSKPKVIEFSGTPEVKTSTNVRILAGPTETFISNVELATLKQDWPPEMRLRYPGATELNRIHTMLRRSIKLEDPAQDNQVGGAQETIRFVSDAPPDRIFSWYGEQLTSQGWQSVNDGGRDASPATQRYVRNREELCVAIDDPAQVRESMESLWKDLAANITSDAGLKKIVGENSKLTELLAHPPSLVGKTVFEIRYSNKSQN